MNPAAINKLSLKRAQAWALNRILGFGAQRYTPEQLAQKTRAELLEETIALIDECRKAQAIPRPPVTTRESALKKKSRLILAVINKNMTVEEADNMRLNDELLYSLWSDEWFDIDMQFALVGVRPSDIL